MGEGGLQLAVLAAIGFVWPRLLAWPLAAFSLWLGLTQHRPCRTGKGGDAVTVPTPCRRAADRSLKGFIGFRVVTHIRVIVITTGVGRHFRPERITLEAGTEEQSTIHPLRDRAGTA